MFKHQPQMVFQDPYGSLNPAKTIGWLLTEPLRLHRIGTRQEQYRAVCEMLDKVGLGEKYYGRYPGTLSGGQRQRVAIAMAIMLRRSFIVLDEPVSALDVTVQEQILVLLVKLQKEFGLTYLFFYIMFLSATAWHSAIFLYKDAWGLKKPAKPHRSRQSRRRTLQKPGRRCGGETLWEESV